MEANILYYPEQQKALMSNHLMNLADENVFGVPFNIQKIDNILDPICDAECGFVLGRPGHSKSVILAHLARQASLQYLDHQDMYAPPVFISAEMSIEEIMTRNLANYTKIDSRVIRTGKSNNDWVYLTESTEQMIEAYPTIYVGVSLGSGGSRNRLTFDYIENTVDAISQKYGKKPRMIVIDYLQRLTLDKGPSDRRIMMSEVVERYKDLCMSFGIPGVMGVQANRDVEQLPFPVPNTNHAKETGNVEETADWMISTMRPVKYWKAGNAIPRIEPKIIVTPELLFVMVLKRRNADANNGVWIKMDAKISDLADLEMDYELKDD